MELYKFQRRIKGIAITFGLLNIIFIILWSIILFEVYLPKGQYQHQLDPTTPTTFPIPTTRKTTLYSIPTTTTKTIKTTFNSIPTRITTTKTTLNSMPSSLSTSSTTQTPIEIETSSTSTSIQENTEVTDKVNSTTESTITTTIESTEKSVETTTTLAENEDSSSSTETITISGSTETGTDLPTPSSEKDFPKSTTETESTTESTTTTTESESTDTTEVKKENNSGSDEEMQSDQAVTPAVPVFSIPIVEKKSLNDIIEEKIDNEDGTSSHQVVFKPTTIKTKTEIYTTTAESTKKVKIESTTTPTRLAHNDYNIRSRSKETTTRKTAKILDPTIVDLEKDPDFYIPPPRSRKSEPAGSPPRGKQNLNQNFYEYSSDPNIDSTRYFEERIRQQRQRDDPEAEFETSYHQIYKRSTGPNWTKPSKLLQCSSAQDKLALLIVSIWSIAFGLINILSSLLLFKGGQVKSYYKTQISLYLTGLTMGMSICSVIYLILFCGSEFPPNNKLLNQPGRLGLGFNLANLLISVIELCATCIYLQTLAKILPMVSLTHATTIQLAKL